MRLGTAFAFVLLALLLLLIRVTYINVTNGKQYARKVLSQQSFDSQTLPSRRGEIVDRNGIALAKSDLYYKVILDCKVINEDKDYLEPTLEALDTIFDLDRDKLRTFITDEETRDSQYRIIARMVTKEQKKAFEDYKACRDEESLKIQDEEVLKALKKARYNIQGVWFETYYERSYPYDSLASNVVGFINADGGVTGLENYYNSMLEGTDGRVYGYLNSELEYEKNTIEPEHGRRLVTTLDLNIQQIVEKYIQEFNDTYGDEDSNGQGAKNIGVVVMDPNSGEVLAMATNTPYNLNDPYNTSGLYSGAQLKNMTSEQYSDALNGMWSNFCVSESYEPGSVFKPITVASALECGAEYDGDNFYCDGSLFITDTTIKCDNIYGHKDETLEYGIVNSCNVVLMTVASRMGITNFTNYQQNFGFGRPTGIDLPNETAGVIYGRNNMHEVELATCSFGQGFTISMVQELAAFSAVINGGYYYQPHMVRQIQTADGSVEKSVDKMLLKQPVSSSVSALLRRYLTTAVREGTGRKSTVPGYLTGGKTGTAEKIDPETGTRAGGKYLVSFIGACPMDDPQVVIYVVVDEPNVYEQADSSYAQVLFRKIATEVFPYMGLYPTEEVTPELLSFLGITEADIVTKRDPNKKSATFDAIDSYGYYHTGCYVNRDGKIVGSSGDEIAGAYIAEDGTIFDAVMNEVGHVDDTVESEDEPAGAGGSQIGTDNPNMASPPSAAPEGEDMDGTIWSGVTGDDLDEFKKD
ncbi:MAG: penicillin-binding transpeptidase domain-containing protein [Lachnospiraceae bacterium]|nr:penicillin-binding transpeptidase domain-containing protein [Lachnospiraceae bacterium]